MKKLTALVLAFVATLTIAAAADAPVKNYTRHYDYKNFTGLAVSNAFNVEFAFADTWSVEVTVPEFVQPYLKVSCTGNKVRIGLEKLPRDVQRKLQDLSNPLQAKVLMPKLLSLSLSGASKMTSTGTQVLHNENLYIEVSGASQLKSFESDGNGTLNIDASGASKANVTAQFDLLNLDISGASKLVFTGNCGKMNLDCSGASGAEITGDALVSNAEISGSSKMKVTGNTGRLKLDVSGAGKYESIGDTAQADVELSGASKCRLSVTEKLNYELSGVSTLRVKNMGAQIGGECSRGSKIEFER